MVVSDLFGMSGREMMASLVARQAQPEGAGATGPGRMRARISVLEEAFTGHFTDHHAFLLARMTARVDAISADITGLDTRIEAEITPFADAVARLDEIPGHQPGCRARHPG